MFVTDDNTHLACAGCVRLVRGRAGGNLAFQCAHCARRVRRAKKSDVIHALLSEVHAADGPDTCVNGCGFVHGRTHRCWRVAEDAQVRVDGVHHRSFSAFAHAVCAPEGTHLLGRHGLVVRVVRKHATGVPSSVCVVHAQPFPQVVRVKWWSVATGNVVQHAIVHGLGEPSRRATLWPAEDTSCTFAATIIRVDEVKMPWDAKVIAAVASSPCARSRWWALLGGAQGKRPAHGASKAKPRMLFGGTGARAAFMRTGDRVVCAVCGHSYSCYAAFVARCAPEVSATCT